MQLCHLQGCFPTRRWSSAQFRKCNKNLKDKLKPFCFQFLLVLSPNPASSCFPPSLELHTPALRTLSVAGTHSPSPWLMPYPLPLGKSLLVLSAHPAGRAGSPSGHRACSFPDSAPDDPFRAPLSKRLPLPPF